MKVMLNPMNGTSLSYPKNFGTNQDLVKTSVNKTQGYSNEQIYNAIMSFKNSITGIFTKKAPDIPKKLNVTG